MSKAVFLDRDGVLNRVIVRNGKPHSPNHLGDFKIISGTREGLTKLKNAGYLLIVATNQPNVARQLQPQSVVEIMHEKLKATLPLDDIRVCYHDDHHRCECRKPLPGLLLSAAKDWGIRLSESYMIGDRWKDVEAGRRAGCKSVLLKRPYNEREPKTADYYAASVLEAAEQILGSQEALPEITGREFPGMNWACKPE
jgi:D-glycero-D-manno-heptose 1,7-bisphosphate phosphatase